MSIKDRSRKLNTTKSRKISEKNDGDYEWVDLIIFDGPKQVE